MRRFRSARRLARPSLALIVAVVALASFGCRSMWDEVRESERSFALESARNRAKRGDCADALADLDRAEAVMAIGRFAIEAIQLRIRCYEKLGRTEEMSAHRRLLEDFYQSDPMAFPAPDGSSVFRVEEGAPVRFDRPPSWLEISPPDYTTSAQRSQIDGRVVVSFGLAENGRTTGIRVLEMTHPLLATWAIEAVAQAKPRRSMKDEVSILESSRSFVTTFDFEWRWANDEPSADAANGSQSPSSSTTP